MTFMNNIRTGSVIVGNPTTEIKDLALETLQALSQIALDHNMPLIEVYKIYLHCGQLKTPIVASFNHDSDYNSDLINKFTRG